jgi:hypothetical protein
LAAALLLLLHLLGSWLSYELDKVLYAQLEVQPWVLL